MRGFTGKGIGTGAAGVLLAAGLLALSACSPASTVVSTSAAGASARPAPPAPPPPEEVSFFQGSVASVDPTAGEVVVDLHMVWAPVVHAGTGIRRVLVDSRTTWDPPGGDLTLLPVGLEVQVKAVPVADDGWRALQIQLVDIE